MLLSAILPLKLRIVSSDSVSVASTFCIACVCNNCHQKNQSRRLNMGQLSHLADADDAFYSSCFSFSSILSPMKMSLTNLTMKGSGSGFTSGSCSFFLFENSVGPVSSSKPVGLVSISKSVGHVSSSESVGRVIISQYFCRVSGLFSVGRIG